MSKYFEKFSSKKANILLVGSGGVGTIASLGLEKGGFAQVTSVLRSDYEKVSKHGFEIKSIDHGDYTNWKPHRIVPNVQAAVDAGEVYDYIVVAIKALPEFFKTEEIIRPAMVKNAAGEYPTVVLIQNGIDIERPVYEAYPGAIVLSGVSMIGSHNFGSKIVQFEHDVISFGYYPDCVSETNTEEKLEDRTHEFVALYAASGVNATYHPQLMLARWRKLVYNSCINTVCAITQLDTGRAYLSGVDNALTLPAMYEILKIAKAAGYELPEELPQGMIDSDSGVFYEPSMMIDVKKGNPIELEVILGNPLRIAKRLGIEAPILTVLYNLLKGVQFRLLENKGGILNVPEKAPRVGDSRIDHPSFPSEFPAKKPEPL
ncbi:hypothetical protein DS838_001153 [Geotrichum bryndzae]|nr:hypothetical protein DS838_001153 [Geotrichum bryndzae]